MLGDIFFGEFETLVAEVLSGPTDFVEPSVVEAEVEGKFFVSGFALSLLELLEEFFGEAIGATSMTDTNVLFEELWVPVGKNLVHHGEEVFDL